MFLTAYNLPHYLLSKGLIAAQSLVDGDFVLAEAGRRNRNFKVMRRNAPGIFVKQIKTTEPQAIMTVQREATFYRAVQSDPKFAALRPLIPSFIDHDSRRHAIALTLTDGAESIQERHMREGRYPEDTARTLGRALGLVHSHGPAVAADATLRASFPCQIPWPLNFDPAMGFQSMQGMGPIGGPLAAALQQNPRLLQQLTALRSEWKFDSLVHNDMKWDNCLLKIPQPGQPPVEPQLTIVDWELADLGDGAWDVATIFKEYIMAVFLNTSIREAAAAQNYPAPAELKIEMLHPSIRAFWQAYAAARGLTGYEERFALVRAARFTAGRMVVAVLEYLGTAQELGTLGNKLLQSASGLLDSPQFGLMQLGLLQPTGGQQ